MRRLEFASEAKADLLDIAGYIAKDSPERALSFVEQLEARSADLLSYPDTGTPRPELAPDLRSRPYGRYIIFYTPHPDVVRVERMLHGARDLDRSSRGDRNVERSSPKPPIGMRQ